MPLRFSAALSVGLFIVAGPVAAAEITLEKFDVFDIHTHHMHIEGAIEPGDVARIRDLTENLPRGRDAVLAVSLNSPGGDVQEGLDIARELQALDMQVVTDVLTQDGELGSCASACSYIFLGGTYRFLNEGSRLGVHQFRYVRDGLMPLSETTRAVQNRSADITALLSDAHVDPGFFSLMGATAPEEMNWVDLETLERFNVVNRERAYQKNEFTLSRGTMKLVMTHIGLFGINRLTAQCVEGDVRLSSEILLSDGLMVPEGQTDSAAITERFTFAVMADGYAAVPDLLSPQRYEEPAVATEFSLPVEHLATLLAAEQIDVRLVVQSGAFIGAGFNISDGKVRDLVESCVELEPRAASTLGGEPDTETTLSPVLVAASLGAVGRGHPLPEVSTPSAAPEEMAVALYHDYLAAWSRPNGAALDYMEARYTDVLDFYGAETTKAELMAEKIAFAERWPDRRYSARPETFEISCPDQDACLVAAIIDWDARSSERGASASGVAWYGLGFDMETGQVLFEDGKSQKR